MANLFAQLLGALGGLFIGLAFQCPQTPILALILFGQGLAGSVAVKKIEGGGELEVG